MTDDEQSAGLTLSLEQLSDEGFSLFQQWIAEKGADSLALMAYMAVNDSLSEAECARTRLVITGDFVSSVQSRDERAQNYSMERGSGTVAAKTMPTNADGIVDILMPAVTLAESDEPSDVDAERGQLVRHLAAHEAVHASVHLAGSDAFETYRRGNYGYATTQFLAMAGEQAEEHLAESLSNDVERSPFGATVESVESSFEAWADTLSSKLPAVAEDDPDYFQKGMEIAFESLHILWKTLAYLAAELRTANGISDPPPEITQMEVWQDYIADWWAEYTSLLGQISVTTAIDIAATDIVVERLALLLQRWALAIGFDFHDSGEGGFFRITLWD